MYQAVLSQPQHTLLTNIPTRDRYSNTLLMSLNNRILIRDTLAACGGIVRFPAGSLPSIVRSEATTDIMLTDMEKCPNASKLPSLDVMDPQERVISESQRTSSTFFLMFLTGARGRRHLMIC